MYFPEDMNFQYFFFDTYIGYFLQALPIALIVGAIYGIIRFGNDKESPIVTGIITAAAHRVDELTPKPEESVAEEQTDEETETDENQISIDELENSDTRDTEVYSENEEMPSE